MILKREGYRKICWRRAKAIITRQEGQRARIVDNRLHTAVRQMLGKLSPLLGLDDIEVIHRLCFRRFVGDGDAGVAR